MSAEWGPVRLVGNLVWLPIVLVSTFWGPPRVGRLGPAVCSTKMNAVTGRPSAPASTTAR